MRYSNKIEIAPVETVVKEEARYLYCIADATESVSLGKIGIEGREVYTIPYKDICAVMHDSPAQPYQSGDEGMVKAWVMTHQQVVDAAWERWGTVLPATFDTIISAGAKGSAEQNMLDWLEQEHEELKTKIERVRDKAEYGVQVFWDPKLVAQNLSKTSLEIRNLEEEIKSKPRGLAYMYRQRLENLIQREMQSAADKYFKDFYHRIRIHADDIRVEKTKKAEQGLQMLLNLSCLVDRYRYMLLGAELDKINEMKGFSVRFTGPWPPYSFVGGF